MKPYLCRIAALTIAATLSGCGGGSGVRFSDLFDESAAAEGTGIQGFGLVRAVVILATHEATARQRQVAEQNGRRAVAQIKARMAEEEKAPPPPTSKPVRKKEPVASTTKPSAESGPSPAVASEPEVEPTPKSKARKEIPRIIAVATEKNEETEENAAQAVMLFDTYSQEVVGNKVYDIEREPRKGEAVRFETYSSIYIGASL